MKALRTGIDPYLLGSGIAIVAVILRLALDPSLGSEGRFLVSYPAVVLSAWVGGPISSVVTTFLLTVATAYFWLPPTHSLAIGNEGDAFALFVFMGVGAVITGLTIAVQRAPTHLTPLHREADNGPKVRDTADERLRAVADALRMSEVLIFVRKRAEKPEQAGEQQARSRLAAVDVGARSSIWIAPSEGTTCDTCGQSINTRDIAYEIVAADHDMCIDRRCYQRLIAAVEYGGFRFE